MKHLLWVVLVLLVFMACAQPPQTAVHSGDFDNSAARVDAIVVSDEAATAPVPADTPASPEQASAPDLNFQSYIMGGPAAQSEANGLHLSLQVSPAPHFFNQLLAVEMALTNLQATTVDVEGRPNASLCGSALAVTLNGEAAQDAFLTSTVIKCPWPGTTPVQPGETLTLDALVPLTASGQVTVTAVVSLCTTSSTNGQPMTTCGRGAPDSQGLALPLAVASTVPPERMLALERDGTRVMVTAPPGAQAELLARVRVRCGVDQSTSLSWEPVPNGGISLPDCSGTNPAWTLSVGAPSYAIAAGTYR
jgi:hypothetical protein